MAEKKIELKVVEWHSRIRDVVLVEKKRLEAVTMNTSGLDEGRVELAKFYKILDGAWKSRRGHLLYQGPQFQKHSDYIIVGSWQKAFVSDHIGQYLHLEIDPDGLGYFYVQVANRDEFLKMRINALESWDEFSSSITHLEVELAGLSSHDRHAIDIVTVGLLRIPYVEKEVVGVLAWPMAEPKD